MYIGGLPTFLSILIVLAIVIGFIISLVVLIARDEEIKELNRDYNKVLGKYFEVQRENTFLKCKYEDEKV